MAVRPPQVLIERLRGLERPSRPGLRWTVEDQWHVTLEFFAEVDPQRLVASLDRWSAMPPGPPPARAVSGPRPGPLNGRVWMVPVGGLEQLAAVLDPATADLDPAAGAHRRRPFRGHLTLARARHPAALRDLPRPELEVAWQVEEVLAFRSELGRDRARHWVIGRWALPADPNQGERPGPPTR